MYDYHIHLERGSYNIDWLQRFIDQGTKRGIKEFGFVEHLYIFKEAKGLLFNNQHELDNQTRCFEEFQSFLLQIREQGFPIKIGLEVDYVPEKETQLTHLLQGLPVDFLIGSVHYLGEWAFDLDPCWPQRQLTDIYLQYYETLLQAAYSGLFDILGHCGNIAYYGYKPALEFETKLVSDFWHKLAKTDIAVEINAGGLYRPAGIVFPELKWLTLLNELNIEVTTSSDAHDPQHTGWQINELVIPTLKKAGYQHIIGFNKRKKIKYVINN